MKKLEVNEPGDSPDAAVSKLFPTPTGRGVTAIDAYPVTVMDAKSMCDMDDEELRESLLNSHYLYGLR